MAHDNSIASKVEAWMVTTIGAADSGGVIKGLGHFAGTMQEAASGQAKELLAGREPAVKVMWYRGNAEILSAADQKMGSEYLVYVGITNPRGEGVPRIGDAKSKGINWCRSLIQKALHDQHPGVSDDNFGVETCKFAGCETVWQSATDWIIVMRFFVEEVPKP